MSNTPSTDQWKHGGNCNVCRRSRYCKKRCNEHKRFVQRAVQQMIAESRLGQMMEAIHQAPGSERIDG